MPSRTELDQVQRALTRLSQAAAGDLRTVWDSLRTSDRMLISRALREAWVGIIETYGDMSATLAADIFEAQAADLRIRRPKTKVAPGVDADRATARLGYAISTPDQLGNALVILDQLVRQPYRSTIQDSAWASGAAWARVPSGTKTCAFCLILASRGAVYRSQASAGDKRYGKEYHGECDCVPTLVRGVEDYPDGYDPDGMYDAYRQSRRDADTTSTRDILKALRQQQGIH